MKKSVSEIALFGESSFSMLNKVCLQVSKLHENEVYVHTVCTGYEKQSKSLIWI